jgi:hypothetical protein
MDSRFAPSLVLVCQSLVWLPAMGQNTLSVPMEVVRISNPDLAAESSGSVTLYRLQPQYTIQTIQGNSRTELSFGGTIEQSSNTDLSANRTLPNVRVLWESSSPVSVLGLRASLEEASTRETEFAEFGRVTRDSTQRTGTIGANWTRDLSAGSELELLASHSRLTYDTPSLVDYSETLGSVVYRFESSANSRYSFSASASRLNPEGVGASASRGELGLGYEINFSEDLTLNARVGAVRTSALRSDTNPSGGLRLAYEGERVGYAVAWSRDVSSGGSVGGYTRSENVEASLVYPFNINTSLALGVSHARSLDADRDAGAAAYARIRSELSRFWTLTMGLEHRRAMPTGSPTARSSAVSVGLVYTHPDF